MNTSWKSVSRDVVRGLCRAQVQAADLWDGEDLASTHDRSRFGSILGQRQMRPRTVVVDEIAL